MRAGAALQKVAAIACSIVLTCGVLPVAAHAQPKQLEGDQGSLTPGTYVEHEALAYVKDDAGSDGQNGQSGVQAFSLSEETDLLDSAETLMTVGGQAEELVFDSAAPASNDAMAARSVGAASDAAGGRIVCVRNESLSTEELIAQLEEDPRVVVAEPNYLIEQADEEADRSPAALTASSSSASTSDMTGFQWYGSNSGAMTGDAQQNAVDIEYDAWEQAAESGTWADAATQEQSGLQTVVIGVVDTGVDAANPDLASVMWDDGLSISALANLGGDEHGFSYDSSVSSTTPIEPEQEHGTHVAGIIAAAWNDYGTSGVAPNAEIMSLRMGSSAASALACFNYVVVAAQNNVPVRAVNCSWTLGATASKIIDAAVTEMGENGVVSLFASGNDGSNVDKSIGLPSILRDNPYAVVVDAIDPSGDVSEFSSWGASTTDVMAPGSTILSTYAEASQSYFGEADPDPALYESFDAASKGSVATASGTSSLLQFRDAEGTPLNTLDQSRRFDGDASLAVTFNAAAAQADETIPIEVDDHQFIQTDPIDLTAQASGAKYLSIRFAAADLEGDASASRMADLQIAVRVKGSDELDDLLLSMNSFRALNSAWGGWYVELPEETDFENFQLRIYYAVHGVEIVGGEQTIRLADGTVLIDSIGIGDDLAPYAYLQGTSMATPVATGVMAVLAGQNPNESAEKLAARLKGGVSVDARYADACSTSGRISVEGSQDPAPVPTQASLSDDGQSIAVQGYFVDPATEVRIGGAVCDELERCQVEGSDGLTEITVQTPEGFEGGEQWVELAASDSESGRLYVDFGTYAALTYYEESLPVPDELYDYNDWQLVGFAGDIYVLPRESLFNVAEADHSYFMKYDPDSREWSRVEFPLDQLKEHHLATVGSVSGATLDGSLILQISGVPDDTVPTEYHATYWRYTAQGEWEYIPMTFPENEQCYLCLSGLASDGEYLYAFGGQGMFDDYPGLPELSMTQGVLSCIVRLDIEKGEGTLAGMLTENRLNAQVSYRDGMFIVSGGQNATTQMNSAMGVERVVSLAQEETRPLEFPFSGEATYPAGWLDGSAVDTTSVVEETGKLAWAPASAADGFMLVGPRSVSNETDTYTLEAGDASVPQEYDRNASHLPLLNPSAVAYEGKLYAMAAVSSEPYRVFAATSVATTPQPGDYSGDDPEPDPGPSPEPVSPDASSDGQGTGDDSADVTLQNLASTDDAAFVLLAVLGVSAAGCLVLLLFAVRRGKRHTDR